MIGKLVPGPAIRSGFDVRLLGWSPEGSECYAELFGHTGVTCDTPVAASYFELAWLAKLVTRRHTHALRA
jgi:hypothetical protein